MGNKMLARYQGERDDLAGTIRQLQDQAAGEDRDLTEAEEAIVEDTAGRIRAIDAKMRPLQDLEALIGEHRGVVDGIEGQARDTAGQKPVGGERLTIKPREIHYGSAGEFMVDLVRAQHYSDTQSISARVHSQDAAQRIAQVVERATGDVPSGTIQTTSDVPGLMPTEIIGPVYTDMDAVRPLIGLAGAKDLAAISGSTFNRPVMTVTADSGDGIQTAELAEGSRGQIGVTPIAFTKKTFLRWAYISFQTIDWTSPGAWDLLLQGMGQIYAEDTERFAEKTLDAGVTYGQTVATDDYAGWIGAAYAAKQKIVTANGTKRASTLRLPDTFLVSSDMDAAIGELIDVHLAANVNSIGDTSLRTFGGVLLKTPRVMLPDLPVGTVLFGRTAGFEFYEAQKGIIQGIEPKVYGATIANGGYGAAGMIDPTLFCALSDPWKATTAVTLGLRVVLAGGQVLKVTTAGTTGSTAPTAPGSVGGTVTDGSAVWTRIA